MIELYIEHIGADQPMQGWPLIARTCGAVMSREKLDAVRTLINQKRFGEARAILETIDDDPQAQKLLDQLNRKAPRKPPRRRSSRGGYLLTILTSAILTALLISGLVVATAPAREGRAPRPAQTRVASEQATVAPTELPTVSMGVVQSSQAVNVRSGPGTNFDVAGSVSSGMELLILGQSNDGGWYNVELPNGAEGWIRSDLLAVEEVPVTLTPVGSAPAEVTPEATPLPTCTPQEVRVWWFTHPLYGQASHAALEARENTSADFGQIIARLQTQRALFEQAEYPLCAESVRQGVLAGTDAILAAVQSYSRGEIETAANQVEQAREAAFDPALQTLNNELSVAITPVDCGADGWYAVILPELNAFEVLVETLDQSAAGADVVRSGVFRTQELARNISAVYFPLCATNARSSLLLALDAGVDLYRAVFDGNQSAVQVQLNSLNTEMNTFRGELNRLGVPRP